MTEALVTQGYGVVNFEESAMSVDNLVHQVALIQEVQKKVMKQGEHFGTIPGCGDKPTLLKPGAEKLGFTFRLAPEFDVTPVNHPNNHREYHVKCRLLHIPTGTFVGEGVGTCTTMEGKFRFRWDNTGKPVPKEYWDTRNADLLGGPFMTTRKIDGKWYVFQRVEHDNPADYYNTCEKMAKKRAHVDAILTATAASDIFTQDIEDMPEVMGSAPTTQQTATQKKDDHGQGEKSEGATRSDSQSEPPPDGLAEKQGEIARMLLMICGTEEDAQKKLKELTKFKMKDGKMYEGKDDPFTLGEKQANVVYGKVKKLFDALESTIEGEVVEDADYPV